MSWNAYLFETTTGIVGKRLNCSSLTWTSPINKAGNGSVVVPISDLKALERKRFDIDYGSILITYTYRGVEKPWTGGYISGHPNEDLENNTFTLDFTGIRGLLASRLTLNNDSVLNKKSVKFTGLSLGTIAQEMVKLGQDRGGGQLPIVFRTPRQTGTHQRTFEWYDVANLDVDKELTDISNVENGPDIMFRPEFTDSTNSRVVWAMYNGTNEQPLLAQKSVADFDTTSKRNSITNFNIDTRGTERVSRVYISGAGQDAGTKIAYAQNDKKVVEGYPYKEAVLTETSVDDMNRLRAIGAEYLRANTEVQHEVSFTVQASDSKYPLGQSWQVGERANVTMRGSLKMPDGTYTMVITEASGDNTDAIKLKLREE